MRFWVTTTGLTVSSTVIVAVLVLLLLLTSVAVKVTVTGVPTLAQVNEVCDKLKEATPQASLEPLLTCNADTVAVPAAFK